MVVIEECDGASGCFRQHTSPPPLSASPPLQQVSSLKLFWWFVQAAELETSLSVMKLVPMICASCQRGKPRGVCRSGVFLSPAFQPVSFCVHHSCPVCLLFPNDIIFGYGVWIFIFSLHRNLFSGFSLPFYHKSSICLLLFPQGEWDKIAFHSCGLAFLPSVRVCHRKKFSLFPMSF